MTDTTRQRDTRGRFIKQGGIMQSDEEFRAEKALLADLVDEHLEALRADEIEFDADMWEMADMADRIPDAIKACDDVEALLRVGAQ
jgi:hypothetical protein